MKRKSDTSPWRAARREEADARRTLILDAATASFNQRGYPGTSMARIAGTLGLTTNALYHYFVSKDEILASSFERAQDWVDELFDYAEAHEGHARSRVVEFVNGLRELIARSQLPQSTMVTFLAPARIEPILGRSARHAARLAALIAAGSKDGSIRANDAHITTALTLAGLYNMDYEVLAAREGFGAELAALIDGALIPVVRRGRR